MQHLLSGGHGFKREAVRLEDLAEGGFQILALALFDEEVFDASHLAGDAADALALGEQRQRERFAIDAMHAQIGGIQLALLRFCLLDGGGEGGGFLFPLGEGFFVLHHEEVLHARRDGLDLLEHILCAEAAELVLRGGHRTHAADEQIPRAGLLLFLLFADLHGDEIDALIGDGALDEHAVAQLLLDAFFFLLLMDAQQRGGNRFTHQLADMLDIAACHAEFIDAAEHIGKGFKHALLFRHVLHGFDPGGGLRQQQLRLLFDGELPGLGVDLRFVGEFAVFALRAQVTRLQRLTAADLGVVLRLKLCGLAFDGAQLLRRFCTQAGDNLCADIVIAGDVTAHSVIPFISLRTSLRKVPSPMKDSHASRRMES